MTDYEHRHAIRQGHENAASDSYFEARPQIDSNDRRKVFQAGFERGWDRHAAQAEVQQPACDTARFCQSVQRCTAKDEARAQEPAPGTPNSADKLARDLKKAIDTATELREQLRLMEEHARNETWRWQADGADDLATMGNRMGVLIYASDLRNLIAAAPQLPAPTEQQAYDMGAKGAPAADAERLLFEAWMRGHCWALCATWDGKCYRSDAEQNGNIDPRAMNTRQLWAAWRDRAALAAQRGGA